MRGRTPSPPPSRLSLDRDGGALAPCGMTDSLQSSATTIRYDTRAHYDREAVHAVLDAAFVAHVGLVGSDGRCEICLLSKAARKDFFPHDGTSVAGSLVGLERAFGAFVNFINDLAR